MPLPHDAIDRSLKRFFSLDPRPILKLAFGDQEWTRITPLPVEIIETIKRVADELVQVEGPEKPFLSHVEFESQPDLEVPGRVLGYNVLFWVAHGRKMPVRSIVVLLAPPPAGFSERVSLEDGQEEYLNFRFHRVDLYERSAKELAANPELAALCPLGVGFDEETAVQAAKSLGETEKAKDRLAVLYLLGRVKGMTEGVLSRILRMEEVRMSDVYQEIMAEGEAVGEQRGLVKGRQEGRLEGRIEAALKMLAVVLTQRFPNHSGSLDPLLSRCTVEDLEWAVQDALNVKQLATLKRHLEARLKGR